MAAAARAYQAAHPAEFTNASSRSVAVSRDGVLKGVIWGTLHTGYNETTIPPRSIRDRLEAADDVTVEVLYDTRSAEAQRQLIQPCLTAARRPDPAALARLDPATRNAVDALRLPRGRVEDYSLMALTYVVAQQQPQITGSNLPSGGSPDLVFTRAARQAGKPLHALERPESQIALFCTDPNDAVAATNLRLAIRRSGHEQAFRDFLNEHYRQGDVAGVLGASHWLADARDEEGLAEERRRLFGERNPAMARGIAAIMAQPGFHFVAIGAGHLAGDDGLVALLRKGGWTVARCVEDRC